MVYDTSEGSYQLDKTSRYLMQCGHKNHIEINVIEARSITVSHMCRPTSNSDNERDRSEEHNCEPY